MQLLNRIIEKKAYSIIVFILIIIFIYGKSIMYEFAIDDFLIKADLPKSVDGLDGLLSIFQQRFNKLDYRPFLVFTYALENYLFGSINPHFSHAINLCIYIGLCILIYYFIFELPIKEHKNELAFIITILFITHPIHANVVCNLKSRDNLMSMLFGMLSLLMILKALRNTAYKKIFYFFIAVVSFSLGILSKIDIYGFILFIPLVILLYIEEIKYWKIVAVFVLLFALIVTFNTIMPNIIAPVNTKLYSVLSFTENPIVNDFTISNRLGAAAMTAYYYIKLLVIPIGYWYYFGYDQVELYPITHLFPIIITCVLSALVIYSIIKFKKNKLLSLSVLGFFILLAYCLNFFEPVSGIIADRYAFMASLCFVIGLAIILLTFSKNYFISIAIMISFIWSLFSIERASAWKDGISLIEHDSPHLEQSYEGQRIAAMTYMEYHDKTPNKEWVDKALVHIKKANKIYPNNRVCQIFEGIIHQKKGDLDLANRYFRQAMSNDTTSIEAIELIGDLKYEQGDLDSAKIMYSLFFNKHSESNRIINKISTVVFEKNGTAAVVKLNDSLINKYPSLYAPYENLAYLFLIEKDTIKAKIYFNKAIKKGMSFNDIPSSLH